MFDTIIDRFGRLDYACNVAGLCITGESVSTTTEAWDKLFQTNSRGTWLCQKYEIIQMQKQQPLESPDSRQKARGSIVNVSSMAGCQGQPNLVAYGASKHAVIGFTKADGMRYGRDAIRINAVCPGAIKTPMLGLFSNDRVGRHLDMLALGEKENQKRLPNVSRGWFPIAPATSLQRHFQYMEVRDYSAYACRNCSVLLTSVIGMLDG